MAFVLGSAAGAVIAYLVLEVIFGRGFKTIRGNWWICLADLVLSLSVALVAVTGLFGYETAIPTPDSVSYAEVEGYINHYYQNYPGLNIDDSTEFQDPEAIEYLTQLHYTAIATAQRQGVEGEPDNCIYGRLRVVYHLNNGSTVTRNYSSLAMNEAAAEQFRTLYSTAEALEQRNPVMQIGKDEIRLGNITVMNLAGAEAEIEESQTQRLLDAVREDLFRTVENRTSLEGEPLVYLNIGYHYPRVEYYYDSQLGESVERPAGEGSDTFQLPIYESYDDTLTVLEELGIQGTAFDPGDYVAVYGIYDRYDLWQDSSTFRLYSGLAYYWVGDHQILSEDYTIPTETTDIAAVEWEDTPLLPVEALSDEEIRMLYELSRPYGDDTDDEYLLLFDTGRAASDGRSHLMLIRFVSEDTLRSLDENLLNRLTLSIETDGMGDSYISQNNALYLYDWPAAEQN